MYLPAADGSCHFDYDGYGSIGTGMFSGNVGGVSFSSLAEMQTLTTEAHGVELDLAAFEEAITFPSDPLTLAVPPTLTLAANGAAIDQGEPLGNINDGFAGTAPDLGAYELGQTLPVYGPGGSVGGQGGSAGSGGGATGGTGGGGTTGGSGGVPPTGGTGPGAVDGAEEDEGCGCLLPGGDRPSRTGVLLLAVLIGLGRRRGNARRR
jgi:hypothetical protein